MRQNLVALACLVGLQALSHSPARARRAADAVLIVERGHTRANVRLEKALRAQLAPRGVRLSVLSVGRYPNRLGAQLAMARRTARQRGAAVVVWLALDGAEPLFVFLADTHGGRIVMRSFGDMQTDERVEAAAIVVRSAMLAYERGERPGRKVSVVLRSTTPAIAPAPPKRPATYWTSIELGYAYAYDDWDAKQLGHHNVLAQLGVRLHAQWRLLAGYQWSRPISLSDPQEMAIVELRPHRFTLGARWQHRLGRWELGAQLTFVAELLSYEVQASPIVEARDVRPLFLCSLNPGGYVGLRLYDRLRLVAEIGLEIQLWTPTLQVQVPSLPEGYAKLGRPEVVRPRLLIALAVDLL